MKAVLPVTVAIPTYCREQVLLDTLDYLFALASVPAEILVLDQTRQHEKKTEDQLDGFHKTGRIRWLRLEFPSIPQAMNRGLIESRQEIVLFLDDDIRPEPDLVAAHHAAHQAHTDVLVAGRVIQPWEEDRDFSRVESFCFVSVQPAWITEFMGGNFSVRRETAIALGGFDENFVRVAYRFEAEFAHRWRASGRRIRFEPAACLHHLKNVLGGTRAYGEHLTTWRPDHAVGAYYFCLRTGAFGELLWRPFRSVMTRHHLHKPWWIPVTLIAELGGLVWALVLLAHGPKYVAQAKRAEHA